jgi:Tol biopolymer transport system component
MDADGGNPKQLTDEFWAGEPALSPDGGQIYFKIADSDKAYIARISLDGGPPTRVSKTPHDSGGPLVSPDGKFIFCQFYERSSSSPWRTGIMNAETGELIRAFNFFISGTAVWTMDSKALIYGERFNANLWRISIEGDAKPQQLSNFESGEIRTFAVSRDFKQFVISRGTATYEAVLLENF